MSSVSVPTGVVGNDFIVARRPRPAAAAPAPAVMPMAPILKDLAIDIEPAAPRHAGFFQTSLDAIHRHSVGVFAILVLLVAGSAIQVGKNYWLAEQALPPVKVSGFTLAKPAKGPNQVVPTAKLSEHLQQIAAQPLNLTIGDKQVSVSSETIRGWLNLVSDAKTGATYIHVDKNKVSKSLTEAAAAHLKAPLNQVTLTRPDGSSKVIAQGRDGTRLGDISTATRQITDGLLKAGGLRLALPIETQAFAAVTPAAFDKMIEIDVSAKRMYLFEKGQLVKQYAISAGASVTPTPIGQFKTYAKLTIQDMSGYTPDGKRYFQPRVRWISYFEKGGYAIHGNYWKPTSTFGNENTSKGCVSLPDAPAKEVYDWAPIGTTVITHA